MEGTMSEEGSKNERAISAAIIGIAVVFVGLAAIAGGVQYLRTPGEHNLLALIFYSLLNAGAGVLCVVLLYAIGTTLLRLALIFGIPILIILLISWLYNVRF
jgi:hypothetical protein